MAKATKKSKKTKTVTKSEVPPVVEELAPKPPVLPGFVTITIAPTDLKILADLLSVSAQTFEDLANKAVEAKDEASATILAARYRLSNNFANKLAEFVTMPEPDSREIH